MTRAAHFDEKEGLRPSLSYSVTLAASKNLINLINSSWSLAFHRHSSHPCTFREYYNLLVLFYSSKPFFINCFTISIFLKPIHYKPRMTKRSNSSGILLLSQTSSAFPASVANHKPMSTKRSIRTNENITRTLWELEE